ncbi:recombinase family protein [Embleya sp. NPDC005575]|uniref:recombinase family protein n=1 Tax=Embleya sp. NPDC005575 TaxID=3156892 RepID=UPI0033AD6A90
METLLLRGVAAIRLSVLTDETTSPARQLEACQGAAAALGIDLGDRIAYDLDVSASKIGPFDRPELGEWLRKPAEFTALVFWRFDRAIRSMADMRDLAAWAKEHRIMLVFAEGIGGTGRLIFDFRNPLDPVSELMMTMFAFAAQVEATSIRERVAGAQAAMRTMTYRWPGGQPPFGYMSVPMPAEHGGSGFTLVPDPYGVEILERIIRELLDGKPLAVIAHGLNQDKQPTWRDHCAIKAGRPTGGRTGGPKTSPSRKVDRFQWTPHTISVILRSTTLLGWKQHKGEPVRDASGAPIMFTAKPLVTREEYDAIGAVLDSRTRTKTTAAVRSDTTAVLLRVIHCADCDGRMYLNKGNTGRLPTYFCNPHSRGTVCAHRAMVRAERIEKYVEREFLRLVGSIEYRRTIVTPGYDPGPEIAATLAELERHNARQGTHKSKSAAALWQRDADALDARLATLEATPARPEQRKTVPTGRTYADDWREADTDGKRAMLLEAGAKLTVRRGARGAKSLDESLVTFALSGELTPIIKEAEALAEAETERPTVPTPAGTRARLNEPADHGDTSASKPRNSAPPAEERRNVSTVLPELTSAGKPRNDAHTVNGWPAITQPRDRLTLADPTPTGAVQQRAPIPA